MHPLPDGTALDAILDVLRRRVEGFPGGHGIATLVAVHEGGNRRCHRHFRTLSFLRRDVDTNGTVAADEVFLGHAIHIVRSDFLQPVAVDEEQTPIATGSRVAQFHGEILAVGKGTLAVL